MKRLIWLFPALIVLCISNARAQETPQVEISGGYSYLAANLNGAHFYLNGGGASATQNLNSWFGGRLEFNAYSGNDAGTVVTAQTITYGPVFSYRRFSRITPFAHLQLGVQHGSTGYLGISEGASKFAIAPGGGFDLALNRRTALRVDGEYLITQFLGLTQQNASVSLGVVVRFGKR